MIDPAAESPQQRLERVNLALLDALTPEQRRLFGAFLDAESAAAADHEDDLLERLGDELADLFPALAPAIRLAWRHLLRTDEQLIRERGRDVG